MNKMKRISLFCTLAIVLTTIASLNTYSIKPNIDNVDSLKPPVGIIFFDAHDVNSDMSVDIGDVFAIYAAQAEESNNPIFDTNKDGKIDLDDVYGVYECQADFGGDCNLPKRIVNIDDWLDE